MPLNKYIEYVNNTALLHTAYYIDHKSMQFLSLSHPTGAFSTQHNTVDYLHHTATNSDITDHCVMKVHNLLVTTQTIRSDPVLTCISVYLSNIYLQLFKYM